MPSAPLFKAVRDQFYARLLILLAIMAGTVFIVYLAAQAVLVQPLHRLMDAANRLAEGDMSKRTEIDYSSSEFGALARCFDRMADSLEQREIALKKSVDSLSESNAELERFAYITSHDLKEPLRTIVSHTQLLQKRLGDQLTPEQVESMDFVTQGAKRMRVLISDLLDYSRVGGRVTAFCEVNMNAVTATALEMLDESIRESGAEVIVDQSLPHVCGDQMLLGLVMQNLVSNAIKYRHLDTAPRVAVSAEVDGDQCIFCVSDNGIGVEPQYREAVFEAFKRLHGPEVYQGTGIGLAIVRRIVERHRGQIWVNESPEGGAAFRFTLPRADGGTCCKGQDC